METICVSPIGFVERDDSNVRDKDAVSRIVLDVNLVEALEGLDGFSHVFVIFWMHEVSESRRTRLKIYPRGRSDLPLVGVFSTRTSSRRNPIGLTLVELMDIRENVVFLKGLDAFDGTPVLDIKPYDRWDRELDAVVPDWWHQL